MGIVRGRTAASSRSQRDDDERDRRKPTASQKTARKAAGKPGAAGAAGAKKPTPKGGGKRTPRRAGSVAGARDASGRIRRQVQAPARPACRSAITRPTCSPQRRYMDA